MPTNDASQLDLELLKRFVPTRVLSESVASGSIYLLGRIDNQDAIAHLQRTALPTDRAAELLTQDVETLDVFLENPPYFNAHAFLSRSTSSLPDLTVKLIYPATDVHIRKYTAQERFVVRETPEVYDKVVVPYIESFPPERLDWVYNILAGKKEADRVLFKDDDPETGFLILPDLKWDQTTVSALYLTALVNTRKIRSLRDLTPAHLPLLRAIRAAAHRVAMERFDVHAGKLRLFVHYQPSYYHFHVHVVHIAHETFAGMAVGQAHLLDDIISLLELSPAPPARSLLAQMTYTYVLGVEHGLYPGIVAMQEPVW